MRKKNINYFYILLMLLYLYCLKYFMYYVNYIFRNLIKILVFLYKIFLCKILMLYLKSQYEEMIDQLLKVLRNILNSSFYYFLYQI